MSAAARAARDLRQRTCDLLLAVGPNAPTLCEGWTCADLAAHLVIRESRPDAAFGIIIPAAAPRTARIQARYAQMDFAELVNRVRSGPPAWSPLRWLQGAANLIEFAVHHEDIRIPNADHGEPLPVQIQDLLWKRLVAGAKLMFRNVHAGLTLRTADGRTLKVRSVRRRDDNGAGAPAVTITGTPIQLLLEATGRASGATIDGDERSRAIYEHSTRGI
ncbi:MAG: hypothetical protein RL745_788 [Actinomycetota bacterium]